jgi:SH3 domain-binding glutamic acid-rich protein
VSLLHIDFSAHPLAQLNISFFSPQSCSEEAVEYGELETFLRLNETWNETTGEMRPPTLPAKPIGVPGASSPSQMAKPAHKALFNASPASSPLRSASPTANKESLRRRNESEFDAGAELTGYGLQGVKVTDDELLALVEELGLGGEDAGNFVKGLSDSADKSHNGEETAVLEDGDSKQQQPVLEAESKTEAEVEVAALEEEKVVEGGDGDIGNAETDVAGAVPD